MTECAGIKSILAEQVTGYRDLLDVLQRERACLVQFDPAGIEALAKEKDTVILKLRLLDEERMRLVNAFSRERGLGEPLVLEQIADTTGDDSFRSFRLQLLSILQGIVELNQFNQILIERSSGTVKSALAFLNAFGVQFPQSGGGTLVSREA